MIHLSNDTIDQDQIYGIIGQLFGNFTNNNQSAVYEQLGFEQLLLSELGGNLTNSKNEFEKLFADFSYHPGPNVYQNEFENDFSNYESFAEVGKLISSFAESIPDFNPCGEFGDGIEYIL